MVSWGRWTTTRHTWGAAPQSSGTQRLTEEAAPAGDSARRPETLRDPVSISTCVTEVVTQLSAAGRSSMPRRRRGTYLKAKEVAEGARREMRKVIGPASQQRRRATLRKALNDAIRKKHIAGPNPASMVELESGESPPPELWTAETERHWRETGAVPGSTMVWRPEQCGAFLDAASGERLYNLYLMASRPE
jgi:hypothetical protein